MLGLLYLFQTFILIALQFFNFRVLLRGELSVYHRASYGTANGISSEFVRQYCLLLQELNALFFCYIIYRTTYGVSFQSLSFNLPLERPWFFALLL